GAFEFVLRLNCGSAPPERVSCDCDANHRISLRVSRSLRSIGISLRALRSSRSIGISLRALRSLRSIVVPVTSETARQWVHIGSGIFALLLRYLTWWQAAGLAVAALVFNAFVLPRIGGRRLYRPLDEARGFPLGI